MSNELLEILDRLTKRLIEPKIGGTVIVLAALSLTFYPATWSEIVTSESIQARTLQGAGILERPREGKRIGLGRIRVIEQPAAPPAPNGAEPTAEPDTAPPAEKTAAPSTENPAMPEFKGNPAYNIDRRLASGTQAGLSRFERGPGYELIRPTSRKSFSNRAPNQSRTRSSSNRAFSGTSAFPKNRANLNSKSERHVRSAGAAQGLKIPGASLSTPGTSSPVSDPQGSPDSPPSGGGSSSAGGSGGGSSSAGGSGGAGASTPDQVETSPEFDRAQLQALKKEEEALRRKVSHPGLRSLSKAILSAERALRPASASLKLFVGRVRSDHGASPNLISAERTAQVEQAGEGPRGFRAAIKNTGNELRRAHRCISRLMKEGKTLPRKPVDADSCHQLASQALANSAALADSLDKFREIVVAEALATAGRARQQAEFVCASSEKTGTLCFRARLDLERAVRSQKFHALTLRNGLRGLQAARRAKRFSLALAAQAKKRREKLLDIREGLVDADARDLVGQAAELLEACEAGFREAAANSGGGRDTAFSNASRQDIAALNLVRQARILIESGEKSA